MRGILGRGFALTRASCLWLVRHGSEDHGPYVNNATVGEHQFVCLFGGLIGRHQFAELFVDRGRAG
jgi:hypothetical protein